MMRCRLQSSPVFVASLMVGADSVRVACEYQTFIVEKTLADKILMRDSYGVRRTFIWFCYKPAAPTELIPCDWLLEAEWEGWSAVPSWSSAMMHFLMHDLGSTYTRHHTPHNLRASKPAARAIQARLARNSTRNSKSRLVSSSWRIHWEIDRKLRWALCNLLQF